MNLTHICHEYELALEEITLTVRKCQYMYLEVLDEVKVILFFGRMFSIDIDCLTLPCNNSFVSGD